jgi:hypothetical protein
LSIVMHVGSIGVSAPVVEVAVILDRMRTPHAPGPCEGMF